MSLEDATPRTDTDRPLLTVSGLETQFPTDRGTVEAVAGVDLTIHPGEIVGLVGESGSGKSVLAESLLRMVKEPGEVVGGSIRLRDPELLRSFAREFPDAVRDVDPERSRSGRSTGSGSGGTVGSGGASGSGGSRGTDSSGGASRPSERGSSGRRSSDGADRPVDAGFVVVEERRDGEPTAGYVDVTRASEPALRRLRGGRLSMVFQDPMNSLNPTITVGEQIAETVRLHQDVGESVSLSAELKRKLIGATRNGEAWRRAIEMLEAVEIPKPAARAADYPHEFSGGMRQRAMIAMALSCEPDLLIADEPTTALDVTIQAQILEELTQLREVFDTAILLITHDLAVVAETCDRVNVMYAGEVVEKAPAAELFANPQHPYTRGLLASTPRISDPDDEIEPIEGSVPDLIDIPYACHFAPRCPESERECFEVEPTFRSVGDDHEAACLRRGDDAI